MLSSRALPRWHSSTMIRSKKSGGKDSEQAEPPLVLGDGLVDREVHLAAFDDLAALDLVASIPEGGEHPVLRLDRPGCCGRRGTGCAAAGSRRVAVPAGGPELPADLEGDDGLAGAGRHREQQPPVALENGFDGAVDRDLLVVALALPDGMIGGREQPAGSGVVIEPAPCAVALPELRRRRIGAHHGFNAGEVVEFDDLVAVRRVGELQPEHLGVVLACCIPSAAVL